MEKASEAKSDLTNRMTSKALMEDLNVLTGNLHPQIYKLKSAFSRCSFDSNSNRVNCQFIKHNAQQKTELN